MNKRQEKFINKALSRLPKKQLYRCSIPCNEWECNSKLPHECTEECPTPQNRCKLHPTAKCVPLKGNGSIVLKFDKKKKIVSDISNDEE